MTPASATTLSPRLRTEVVPDLGGAGSASNSSPPTGASRPEAALPREAPRRLWTEGPVFVDLLPSDDLGNSSFLVGDRRKRVAAVIDPTRDVGRYLDRLDAAGLALQWVLDTHLHADFVSGGAELARLGGATLGIGSDAETRVPHRALDDHDEVALGAATLTVVKSPGHSPEHVSYLLSAPDGTPQVLFSGGSLMAGTAGRPDLLGPAKTYGLVREEYATLHQRYAKLPSSLEVFPTHVGGSFCGVGTGHSPVTTLGQERRTNPLVRATDRARFAAAYLSEVPFPSYYRRDRQINESGAVPLGRTIPSLPALTAAEVDQARRRPGTTVLDIRAPREFARVHVPGSLSVPRTGTFSAWVGWLRPAEEEFVIVDDDPAVRRAAQIDLLRIGYDGAIGYLDGGIPAYARAGLPLAFTRRTTMRSLRRAVEAGEALTIVDARNAYEAAAGRIPGAINLPLPELPESAARLDRSVPVYVHCQSGRRAGIAASVLEQLGFSEVRHVVDGPDHWAPRSPRSRGGIRA